MFRKIVCVLFRPNITSAILKWFQFFDKIQNLLIFSFMFDRPLNRSYSVMLRIGATLVRLRNKREMSQQEIADFVGVKQTTYQSWESDKTSVKLDYLPKLAEALSVEMVDLLPKDNQYRIVNNSHNKGQSVNAYHVDNQIVDYKDELISTQRRHIELLELRINELEGKP
jgi:transcriptional regulator with XRE-family HTH domain